MKLRENASAVKERCPPLELHDEITAIMEEAYALLRRFGKAFIRFDDDLNLELKTLPKQLSNGELDRAIATIKDAQSEKRDIYLKISHQLRDLVSLDLPLLKEAASRAWDPIRKLK